MGSGNKHMPSEIKIDFDESLKVAKVGSKLLSALSMLAIGVSLVVIAVEICRVTYLDEENHYIMHIGVHDVHHEE